MTTPTTKVMYGLRYIKTGELLGVETRSNAGEEFCCDTQHILSTGCKHPWLVDSAVGAGYVRKFSTEWYNADYETPANPFKPEELEVVQVTITTSIVTRNPEVPDFKEYMQRRYNTKGGQFYDPGHYNYIIGEMKRWPDRYKNMSYSVYDLMRLHEEERKRRSKHHD